MRGLEMTTVYLKRISLALLLSISLLTWSPLPTMAEGDLEHSGKLQLKLERIGQNGREDEDTEAEADKETELDKRVPDLFKEQTRAAIQTKQKEQEDMIDTLQQSLFTWSSEHDATVKETEEALFANDYTAPIIIAAGGDSEGENSGGLRDGSIFAVLFSLGIAFCGGIYAMMRKVLE